MKIKIIFLAVLSGVAFLPLCAQKKAIDYKVYDQWKSISSPQVSDNGEWIVYSIVPQRGDSLACIYNIRTSKTDSFPKAAKVTFFDNGEWVAFTTKAPFDDVRRAKIEKVKKEKMPKDGFRIIRLKDMASREFPEITGYKTSAEGSLVAYTSPLKAAPVDSTESKPKPVKGDRLVVLDVKTDREVTVDSVTNFFLSKKGNLVIYVKGTDSLKSVYAYVIDPKNGGEHKQLIAPQRGDIPASVAIDDNGTQAAFLVANDTTKHTLYTLYYFNTAAKDLRQVAKAGDPTMLPGYAVSQYGRLLFNKEGDRLQFNIAPKPKEIPKDTLPDDEKFSLDLWSWHDTLIQSQQIANKKRLAEESYTAVYDPKKDKWVALGDYTLERIIFAENNPAPFALGISSRPYNFVRTWDGDAGADVYLVDVTSGKRTRILQNAYNANTIFLSPSAKYVAYYHPADTAWYAVDTGTLRHVRLTAGIPYALYDEDYDMPSIPRPYGLAGWTKDEKMIVQDRYDLWLLDPSGKTTPVNLTKTGRSTNTWFSLVNLSRDEKRAFDLSKPLLLASFNRENKQGGYYRLDTGGEPRKLIEGGYAFTLPAYAKKADRIVFSRENFNEFRDLWTSNEKFENPVKFTDANPQQKEYKWGSVEMISWTDFNGNEVKGLLYLPENYDPGKKYPTIVYFYETHTDQLYRHHQPQPSWSIIIPTVCTSNDYVVFMPDIKYTIGYPGQSCYNAVVSGTMALIERGIADRERIGLQGQSWGGYQIAYLVTQTDLYRCCAPGAPVSNMTSAYGGIRSESGLARSFQYEQTQSRIGSTPWERRDLYIDNSPLFFADRMNTPMLIRHDDADEAVPWSQGIEYFIALRRLGKPAWMLNYNKEPHNLRSRAARMDWDKRMYQFFDHYLKDAPAPRWLVDGISVHEKGIDQKLDLVAD